MCAAWHLASSSQPLTIPIVPVRYASRTGKGANTQLGYSKSRFGGEIGTTSQLPPLGLRASSNINPVSSIGDSTIWQRGAHSIGIWISRFAPLCGESGNHGYQNEWLGNNVNTWSLTVATYFLCTKCCGCIITWYFDKYHSTECLPCSCRLKVFQV